MRRLEKKFFRGMLALLITASLTLLLVACGGGDTGGDGESFDGSAFNDSDENVGSINLEVVDDLLGVADTSGFRVRVIDAQGLGVPAIQIACDTEQGLALLEPTTGFELTDSSGQMSGRVGCIAPGSYQVGCRLPIGGNKRSLKTIVCEGPIPEGFTGFPGAGGGSLGTGTGSGGSVPPANNGSVRVSAVSLSENGEDNTLSIDVERGTCGTATITAEPFTDSFAKFTVKNETSEVVNFSSFSYEVSQASGSGTFFSSNELAFSGGGSVAANGSVDLTALFLKANSTGKRFTGSSANISSTFGFRNVTFTLFGTSASGNSVETQVTIGVSFGNFNKCTS